MNNEENNKDQLLQEIIEIRRRMAELNKSTIQNKLAEEELIKSEERYRSLVELSPDMIALHSRGKYVYVNPAGIKLLGASGPGDLIGKSTFETIHPDFLEIVKERYQQLEQGEEVPLLEEKYIRLDGTIVDVEVAAFPIPFQGEPMVQVIARNITKRKRAEEALRKEKDKAQKYLDVAGVILVVIEESQRVSLINKKGCEVLGYSEEEIIGANWFDMFLPESERDRIKGVFARLMAGEVEPIEYFENRILPKSGEEKIIGWRNTLLRDEAGNIIGTLSSGEDIAERKRAEEALRKSEEEAQRLAHENAVLAEIGRIISSTLSIEEVYKLFSDEVKKLLAYDRIVINLINKDGSTLVNRYVGGDSAPGRNVGEVFPKAGTLTEAVFQNRKGLTFDSQNENEVAAKYPGLLPEMKAGFRSFLSVPLISRDQPIGGLHFRSQKSRIYSEKDLKLAESIAHQIAGAIANARLFAGRQQTEKTLRESEEKYRILVENANDAIFIAQDGVIKFANIKAEELLGYSAAELVVIPFVNHILPDDRNMVLERHRNRLEGKAAPGIYSFRIRNRSGDELWVELNSVYILWEERAATLNFLRNITEQKKLETQFLQAQKMEAIGRLAGGIAHDFNNFLTIINTNAQLALMELRNWDPLKEKLESIRRAGEGAANLTKQLLAFTRRQVVEMKVIDLNTLLQELGKMLVRVMGEDIELSSILGKGLGRVKADPGQIEQVILNLVVNAKDAMPSGGKLTIETANMELNKEYTHTHLDMKPGRYVMLSVSDTGAGMTPEVRERIFEPFFTTKEKGKGTGLGLSTVYGVVNQNGGYIWVYSEPGQGTTFKIYLPRVDEPLEEEIRKREGKGRLPGGRETILVVEDEEEVRKLAVAILRKHGYRILEASHGGDAFLICEQGKEQVHLLLTDVVMPGLNGPELARRLVFFYPEMKVLFMSGYRDNAILQQGVLDHGVFFLQKPFSMEGLVGKVREVLDR